MERKTMIRIVMAAILFVVLAIAGCFALIMCSSQTPLESARVTALNTLLDQTGAKERVDAELRAHADELSEKTGLPSALVETGIDMLNVKEWKATVLPSDAVETSTFKTEVNGQQVQLTTYKDPSYVTVNAYGQTVTFDIPESAQTIAELAPYAQDAQESGLLDEIYATGGADLLESERESE